MSKYYRVGMSGYRSVTKASSMDVAIGRGAKCILRHPDARKHLRDTFKDGRLLYVAIEEIDEETFKRITAPKTAPEAEDGAGS